MADQPHSSMSTSDLAASHGIAGSHTNHQQQQQSWAATMSGSNSSVASNNAAGVNSLRLFTPLSTQTLIQQASANPTHQVDNRMQQGLFQSASSDSNPQSIQQRMFGMLNEAGTNITHVPTALAAPGQSFTFQHARFALSGAELNQMLA